jgi:ureidoglycolate lyase
VAEEGIFTVRAEPLTASAFAPFGQVVGQAECRLELRDGEEFHLNVLSYDHRPVRIDHLNRHHRATQALVPLNGKPAVIVVAPPAAAFRDAGDLTALRAFVMDGSSGINLALGVWHEGPFALADRVELVNVQGRHVEDDNEVAYLERDLGLTVEVKL